MDSTYNKSVVRLKSFNISGNSVKVLFSFLKRWVDMEMGAHLFQVSPHWDAMRLVVLFVCLISG